MALAAACAPAPAAACPATVIVISPHLDDAVLSCGALLAAHPGSVAITVFAGTPPGDAGPPTDWDLRTGFAHAGEAMRARRDEDLAALGLLGCAPRWMAYLDSQYGGAADVRDIAASLRSALDACRGAHAGEPVAVPMGLFHGDHLRVHEAARLALQDGGWQALFYEDVPYRAKPGLLQARLAGWAAAGQVATPADVTLPTPPLKAAALACYASQWRALGEAARADALRPERYWHLAVPAGAAAAA